MPDAPLNEPPAHTQARDVQEPLRELYPLEHTGDQRDDEEDGDGRPRDRPDYCPEPLRLLFHIITLT